MQLQAHDAVRIRALLARGLKQAAVARIVGTSQSNVSRVANEQRWPSCDIYWQSDVLFINRCFPEDADEILTGYVEPTLWSDFSTTFSWMGAP